MTEAADHDRDIPAFNQIRIRPELLEWVITAHRITDDDGCTCGYAFPQATQAAHAVEEARQMNKRAGYLFRAMKQGKGFPSDRVIYQSEARRRKEIADKRDS